MSGLTVVDIKPISDIRGFFARAFCVHEFEKAGIDPKIAQCNISFNKKAGTLRGLHYQASPFAEGKLVRCTRGAIFDVAEDVRQDSATYLQWFGLELSADNHRMLCIPKGFAHGFQTLVDDSEVFYMASEFYHPESEKGLRWDDPKLAIDWPLSKPTLSDKDSAWPLIDNGARI